VSAHMNPTGSAIEAPTRGLAQMRQPGTALAEAKPARPIDVLRKQLASLPEIAQNLPSTVSPDKFRNVVITAANMTPDLLGADRRSLLGACVKCAADGLVPDGREAALVLMGNKVQYMPMIAGVLKRARNSGEIASLVVQVVYERDAFTWSPCDPERPIQHTTPPLAEERGAPIGAYAIARLKDGSVMAEVMSKAEIEKVRGVSRAKGSGPWVQWWDQMARKTVLRRLSKYLPMDAAPMEALLQRDEERPATPTGEEIVEAEAVEILDTAEITDSQPGDDV
jgi:recombination protein RecT